MIRVARGPEPRTLRLARRSALSKAILDRRRAIALSFDGYEVCRDELVKALNRKCVFCEKGLRPEGSPVEHFRPKACVVMENGVRDASRYWWLAWTWSNLLFACIRCNTNLKGNQFPLVAGSPILPELSEALHVEQPLLIDPAREQPLDHIKFRPDDTGGVERWVAVPVRQSMAGEKTIDCFGLDRDDDANLYARETVEGWIRQLRAVIAAGDPRLVKETWENMKQSLFSPTREFQALAHDMLELRIPLRERELYGLELPVLGAEVEALDPVLIFEDPEDFKFLTDEELKLEVRALGERAEPDAVRHVIARLLVVREWSVAELARVLCRTEGTVRRYLAAEGVPPAVAQT